MASSPIRYWSWGLLVLAGSALAQPVESVRDVQFTSQPDVTRVVIALSGEAVFHTERIDNPDRVFFDLPRFVPRLAAGKQRSAQLTVNDRHIRQIRVAENQPGLTRLVFDVESPEVVYKATLALDPPRLIVEFRRSGGAPSRTLQKQTELIAKLPEKPPEKLVVRRFDPSALPVRRAQRQPVTLMTAPPEFQLYPRVPAYQAAASLLSYIAPPALPIQIAPEPRRAPAPVAVKVAPAKAVILDDPLPRNAPPPVTLAASIPKRTEAIRPAIIDRAPVPDRSMIRALGLKVSRIVIDPGHGGQDFGTSSPGGLHEKELVLDVSKRLATLLRRNLSDDVILTRTDDSFVSLEERTVMANEKKADLFISIHANSSPAHSASGIETFYLNFAASPGALDVASRENASSRKKVHELTDLLQKIALNSKLDESREFATNVQNALITGDKSNRNRGVKRAAFIVLIGADMPAVLTEIGFVSNPTEEANLRRGDYRQKLAEQLYKGIESYVVSLKPMQVAQRNQPNADTQE